MDVPTLSVKRQLLMSCLILALAALGLGACTRGRGVEAAREDRQPTVTPLEQDFMMKATQAHLSEIDMSRLAMQKSQNSDVRDFAHMIQSDHTRALEDLADLMQQTNVPQPNTLAAETKMDIETMTALSGADFDREFVNMMVSDHQQAVGMFHDQSDMAQTPDVKKYAEDLLPKLQMHLEKAQKLQSKLFGGGKR